MVFFTLLALVATVVLHDLFRPKPKIEDARPSGLGDFNFTTATEGRPVQIVVGRVKIKGLNLIGYSDFDQEPIVNMVKSGLIFKKTTQNTIGFRYNLALQLAICIGPDVVLKKLSIGDKEVFSGTITGEGRVDVDKPDLFGGDTLGSGGVKASVDFFPGSKTQTVSVFLDTAARQRITSAATPTASRYIGTSHLVVRELTNAAATAADRGAYLGNSSNTEQWDVEVERFPALFSGQSAGENVIGGTDANPINWVYEILTNTEWGFGAVDAEIDVGIGSSFVDAADTMITEVNGMAMNVDTAREAIDLLNEVNRQIDGVIFIHPTTGKWTVQLVRAASDSTWGYDIDNVLQLTDDTIEEVRDYSPGTWEDTTNQIQVKYFKRVDDYKESYAPFQNMANAILLAGGAIAAPRGSPSITEYPGVKTSALAVNIAWRDGRAQSRPLKRATFVVNRTFFTQIIGGVAAWTDADKFSGKVPMRVMEINYGTLTKNHMTLKCVEDVWRFVAASYGDPPATQWVEPTVSLVAYPSAEQLAFEAPRALIVRDPDFAGNPDVSKIYASVRRQDNEVGFDVNVAVSPPSSFVLAIDDTVVAFAKLGELNAALAAGTAIPTTAITVTPTPDSQIDIEAAFDDATTDQDLGVNLTQLVLVGGTEFMLVTSAVNNGGNVDLQNVHRGVLDSAQESHASGADVFLIFLGGSLTDTLFATTDIVDVELRMRSTSATFGGSVTTISLTMAKRALRPYLPAALLYNGSSSTFLAPALEGDGAGLNGVGFDVDLRRRRFDTSDEVQELLQDNAVTASTEHRVTVFVDPLGADVQVFQSAWFTGIAIPAIPTQVAIIVPAAAGTLIRVRAEARHDHEGEVDIEARTTLDHDVTPTSPRTSEFYLGGDLRAADVSNTYTVADATVHNVTIGAAYSTSDVEVSINGGGFTVIISAGGTTGVTGSLSVSDTLRLRHTANESPDPNFVEVDNGTSDVAYGAFSA